MDGRRLASASLARTTFFLTWSLEIVGFGEICMHNCFMTKMGLAPEGKLTQVLNS